MYFMNCQHFCGQGENREFVMYLYLGQSVVLPHREILAIFDLDNASWAYKTREFLERQNGRVDLSGLPMTFPGPLF